MEKTIKLFEEYNNPNMGTGPGKFPREFHMLAEEIKEVIENFLHQSEFMPRDLYIGWDLISDNIKEFISEMD